MRSKVFILWVMGLLLVLGLNGSANSQLSVLATRIENDSCDIAIQNTTAYPGRGTWVTVWMKNPVPVAGYSLTFMLAGNPDVARFTCDTSGYWCFIDTTDCLASNFSNVFCVCVENGSVIRTVGWGYTGFIPSSPNYRCLFKIRMDVCCIPDSETNRSVPILLALGSSSLSDTLGYDIPLRDHMGELFVWWSVPGDANGDSSVNAVDVVFLINYLFIGGPEPCVCEAADCNNDGVINASDVVYLINYLFIGGPAPLRGSVSCWHEDCWP